MQQYTQQAVIVYFVAVNFLCAVCCIEGNFDVGKFWQIHCKKLLVPFSGIQFGKFVFFVKFTTCMLWSLVLRELIILLSL